MRQIKIRLEFRVCNDPKICARCGEEILQDELQVINRGKGKGGIGFSSYCRECRNLMRVERRNRREKRLGLEPTRNERGLVPFSEIAKETGLSLSLVKAAYYSGMGKFKKHLEENPELAKDLRDLLVPEPESHIIPIAYRVSTEELRLSEMRLLPVPYPPRKKWAKS